MTACFVIGFEFALFSNILKAFELVSLEGTCMQVCRFLIGRSLVPIYLVVLYPPFIFRLCTPLKKDVINNVHNLL